MPVALAVSGQGRPPFSLGRSGTLVGNLGRIDGLGGVGGAPLVVYAKQTGAADYVAMTSVITVPDRVVRGAGDLRHDHAVRRPVRRRRRLGRGAANVLLWAKANITTALTKQTRSA